MRTIFASILLLSAPALAADRIMRMGADEVRLMDLPCPYASVLRFIPEASRKDFQKADSVYAGQRYFACWRNVNTPGGPMVYLVYEDGDQGFIPVSALKDVPTI